MGSRGNEARIWSGHHLQNDLCLARLRNAPRLCTLTSPRRWAYVPEPLGYLLFRGCMTAPRFSTWLPPSREREVAAGHLPIGRILSYMIDWSVYPLQSHLSLARLRSAPCLCTRTSPCRWAARAGAGMSFWSITFLGVATGLRLVSALGCHLHERGRGWPPFSFRGADGLPPILMTCMSRGNEARIWSGHHLQNDLCLARLRSAPRPCSLTSPWRWAYVPEPLGH